MEDGSLLPLFRAAGNPGCAILPAQPDEVRHAQQKIAQRRSRDSKTDEQHPGVWNAAQGIRQRDPD